jgi:N-acetylneuraminic acid mutarotase
MIGLVLEPDFLLASRFAEGLTMPKSLNPRRFFALLLSLGLAFTALLLAAWPLLNVAQAAVGAGPSHRPVLSSPLSAFKIYLPFTAAKFKVNLTPSPSPITHFTWTDSDSSPTNCADMPTDRARLATTVFNGKIYVLGGENDSGRLTLVEEYDPVANSWTTRASMPTVRGDLGAVSVNGKIYAIGGWNSTGPLAIVEEYDPTLNTWTTRASMANARGNFGIAVVSGLIYVLGGESNPQGGLTSVEAYDPSTNTWSPRASLPAGERYLGAAAVNGKIYTIGGMNNGSRVREYNPNTDTWITRADMPTARRYLGVVAMDNNRIYAIGGTAGDDFSETMSAAVEEYDPATNTWTSLADLPKAINFMGVAAIENELYVIGGWDGMGHHLSSVSLCGYRTGGASTPAPSMTPSLTNTPSRTPTASQTPTSTPTPSRTPTLTPSQTPTSTSTSSSTPTPSQTPTATDTPSLTPTPSETPTPTDTSAVTPTPTAT